MTATTGRAAWPLHAALIASISLLAACASAPPPVLLTLPQTVSAPAAANAAAPATVRVLSVSRPEIPEYMVARRVRYRAESSTLGEWPDVFWAERIEIGMGREFNAALRERLPGWRLCEANCGEQSPAASLQVALTRLDYVRNERRLKASGRIVLWSSERVPRLLYSVEFDHEIAGDADTPQSQARTLTELLQRVATDAAALVVKTP